MFETHSSAAFPFQYDRNITLWNWVELGVAAPFFMLEIAARSGDAELVIRRMTSDINVLRNHVHNTEAGVLKRVFLLSPGYVNGSDSFQLDALDSVCSSPNNPMNMLFKLSSGRTLYSRSEENRLDESQYIVEVFKHSPKNVVSDTVCAPR